MKERVCEAIAVSTSFSFQDVWNAYELYQSFDLIIMACNYAMEMGIPSLSYSIAKIVKYRDAPD